jgi:hypothetical protein
MKRRIIHKDKHIRVFDFLVASAFLTGFELIQQAEIARDCQTKSAGVTPQADLTNLSSNQRTNGLLLSSHRLFKGVKNNAGEKHTIAKRKRSEYDGKTRGPRKRRNTVYRNLNIVV